MKKIILRSIVIILIILNVFVMYLISQSSNNKVLEEIRIINLKNDKSIAIMVQDTNTDEWHEADNRDSWPSPTTHGFVGAECTDSEGDTLKWEDILTFSLTSQTATIKTKQTVYCTLYFAKGEPALDWLKKKGGNTFAGSAHTTIIDGMYRFVGTKDTVTNNYICFGTVSESECINNAKTYMYRIIGITSSDDNTINLPSKSLKIIKATPSSESQQWHNNHNPGAAWDASDMKTYLNETFYNATFVTEETKIPDASYWESIILNHSWYNTDYTSLPAAEPKKSHTDASKIGLIYATDYKNSGVQYSDNWLFIANGWSTNSTLSGNALNEWTMSRFGYYNYRGGYDAWFVPPGDVPNTRDLTQSYSVRPVFYLQLGVNLTGEGTKDHPYIIATMNNA